MPSWAIYGNERTRGPVVSGAAGPTYTGPGDIVAGAAAWWGLRAYSAAQCTGSQVAISIQDDAVPSHTADILILASGMLDNTTLNAFIAANGNASINKVWDQTGAGNHLIQSTFLLMPKIIQNAIGGTNPSMSFTSNARLQSTSTFLLTQPFTFSGVIKRPSFGSNNDPWVGFVSADVIAGFKDIANEMRLYAGVEAVTGATIADGSNHAVQALFSGASSNLYVDGNTNILSPFTDGVTNDNLLIAYNFVGTTGNINMNETGVWTGDQSAHFADLNTNQHGSNGWNF